MIGFLFRKRPSPEELRRRAKYAEERASRPPNKVKALARAYCEELGLNPDVKTIRHAWDLPVPLWRLYCDKAEAALSDSAMKAALRKIGEAE